MDEKMSEKVSLSFSLLVYVLCRWRRTPFGPAVCVNGCVND